MLRSMPPCSVPINRYILECFHPEELGCASLCLYAWLGRIGAMLDTTELRYDLGCACAAQEPKPGEKDTLYSSLCRQLHLHSQDPKPWVTEAPKTEKKCIIRQYTGNDPCEHGTEISLGDAFCSYQSKSAWLNHHAMYYSGFVCCTTTVSAGATY